MPLQLECGNVLRHIRNLANASSGIVPKFDGPGIFFKGDFVEARPLPLALSTLSLPGLGGVATRVQPPDAAGLQCRC